MHRKPTHTNKYIQAVSLAKGARLVCKEVRLEEELNHPTKVFKDNGYNFKTIKQIIKKTARDKNP